MLTCVCGIWYVRGERGEAQFSSVREREGKGCANVSRLRSKAFSKCFGIGWNYLVEFRVLMRLLMLIDSWVGVGLCWQVPRQDQWSSY